MAYNIQSPFILIIFGASGDLAKLKLFPAIYSLMEQDRLPKEFYIVGFARTKKTRAQFQEEFFQSIKNKNKKIKTQTMNALLEKIYYVSGQYDDLKSFQNLKKAIKAITKNKDLTKLAYFSVPPIAFKPIIANLGKTKNNPDEDIRLIMEKPFGQDMKSATELFHFVAQYFAEDQIYLLDHYLAKAGVQSILHLRHGNRILNLLMRGSEISNIQITAFEDIGIEDRVGYFDQVGIIKDMIQSHLLQILAMITMSIPVTKAAESFQREKNNILSSLTFRRSVSSVVLGQYASYRTTKDVPKKSITETFAALRLFIDRESWYQVPIYIRTGKKLHKKQTYIVIEMKKFAFQSSEEEPNRLVIEIQPEELLSFKLLNKHGVGARYQEIKTSESIAYTGEDFLPEHGILLLDVIRNRRVRFLSIQEVLASWKLTDTLLKHIKETKTPTEIYQDGSTGPASQSKLTLTDGFSWYDI